MELLKVLLTEASADYELLDSGDGEKLERFGSVVLRRPDPQALWPKRYTNEDWKKADGVFSSSVGGRGGSWKGKDKFPKQWNVSFPSPKLTFVVSPSSFKHVGLFPEQSQNWAWISEQIKAANRPVKVLNLFGYTGGATLAALSAGAEVVHVDGSKVSVGWAKSNVIASGLGNAPVRWIVDDAKKFVDRELRRGSQYDAIIMDPPTFGHGAKGEVWKIENDLLPLLASAYKLLSDHPLFFIINGYSAGYSAIAYGNNLKRLVKDLGGSLEFGELAIKESGDDGRLLPSGIYARWHR